MKAAFDLLRQLHALDITLEAGAGGKLIAKASKDKLTMQWREQIADLKPALLAALDLDRRIHTMAKRWAYSDAELDEVLSLTWADPEAWLRAVALDELRFGQGEQRGPRS